MAGKSPLTEAFGFVSWAAFRPNKYRLPAVISSGHLCPVPALFQGIRVIWNQPHRSTNGSSRLPFQFSSDQAATVSKEPVFGRGAQLAGVYALVGSDLDQVFVENSTRPKDDGP